MRRRLPLRILLAALAAAAPAHAQQVVRNDEFLPAQRPEAWAMRHFTAATTMTAFGRPPALAPGEVRLAVELAELPHLDATQRRVGFNGDKLEDLNKSPAFGRARAWVGLPWGWVGELGYTPPLEVNGARPQDLLAAALARRVLARGGFVLSARVLGQHGAVVGDITCPRELVGVQDPARNPYGCEAPSHDRMQLNAYGVEATAAWARAGWEWHATAGNLRMEPEVQVDALTFGFRDRSRLNTRGNEGYLAIGAGRDGRWWTTRVEVLYVPLRVQRTPAAGVERDALVTLRVLLGQAVK